MHYILQILVELIDDFVEADDYAGVIAAFFDGGGALDVEADDHGACVLGIGDVGFGDGADGGVSDRYLVIAFDYLF